MTSPYLNRPARSLSEALRARGLTPADIGIAKEPHRQESKVFRANESSFTGHSYARALLVGICLISAIWMAVSFADQEDSGKTAFELEAEAERLENSVMPAAGQH
ncbi:MAG: hypothetical protein HOI35_09150 [Woeseia sp.]|jgi:hypothetical protein|nr:hypothetical protein [Woeseia sp.]